ncbi:cholinesterase-like [Eucyclogobius newberryi]|uniref:cholinesterase-like n=1 Tax=Eucyclogobius newberryi TaxID=166745 RepID=UPI003B5BA3AA
MASSLCPLTGLFLLLLSIVNTSWSRVDDLVVQTKNGNVQGALNPVLGGHVRVFLGIPYAKPPLGPLRFRPPQPAEKWNKNLEAFSYPNSCYQLPDNTFPGFLGSEIWNPNTPVSEDCLYLNVWSPHVNRSEPQPLVPVMVWIYGGGFSSGTSSLPLYNGLFLSKSENVVVVSMNYRLGALGFLSLPNHNTIKGNVGLLDQQLALRWVADNIAAFGGDPSKVTIFGESAGSAAVGFHLLSPGSQELFQRAVMQSGCPIAPWAHLSQETAWKRAESLVEILGCPLSPAAKMEACLQEVSAKDIVTKQFAVPYASSLNIMFAPVVDGIFLPLSIQDMLSSNELTKKDVLFGLNQNEGTYFLPYGVPGFNLSTNSISRAQFLQGIPIVMPDAGNATRVAAIFQYTDWTDEYNLTKNRDHMGNLYGDSLFVCPVLEFIQKYSQIGGRSFLYWFDHRSSVNPWPEWMGVMHGYEIEFVFGMPLNETVGYTKKEVNMTKKFMKHWTNFARTGNPSIDGAGWPSFTADKMEYVTLNYNQPETRRQLRAHECHFWNTVVPEIQTIYDTLMECSLGNVLRSSLWPLLLLLVMSVIFQL